MPGSSPTMARREPTRRLNSVDLPTLGRPTMAMSGAAVGLEDEVKMIRDRVEAGALTCLVARRAGFRQLLLLGMCSIELRSNQAGPAARGQVRAPAPTRAVRFRRRQCSSRERCADLGVAAIIETLCP